MHHLKSRIWFIVICSLVICFQNCSGFDSVLSSNAKTLARSNSNVGQFSTASVLGRWTVGNGVISLGTSARTAGAIDSLIFNNKEFINATDHGRELQVAYTNFGEGECNNPTEAGSADDNSGSTSTTQLLAIQAQDANLQTTQNLAYWLLPNETSPGCPSSVSNHNTQAVATDQQFSKNVQIGYNGDPQIITYDLAVNNNSAVTGFQIESPTGYLGAEFSSFYMYIPSENRVQAIDMRAWQTDQYGSMPFYGGEQPYPSIVATTDGQFAMGVISPYQNGVTPNYALLTFPNLGSDSTNKWSIVFRFNQLPAETLRIRSFIVVGTLREVEERLAALSQNLDINMAAFAFDHQLYLEANADLSILPNLMQLAQHWVDNGIGEGRRGSAFYDNVYYEAAYADLQKAFGSDLNSLHKHYIVNGIHEGRRASLEFDPVFYLNNNPDLKAAFGSDYRAAANHWALHGINEGRDGSADFSPAAYLARYADLQQAFGNTNYDQALIHWIAHGKGEGRIGTRLGPPPSVSTQVVISKIPIYRFYKPQTGEHFFSLNSSEGPGAGFNSEGIGFSVIGQVESGSTLLYRCYDLSVRMHFTSTDVSCEIANAVNEGAYGSININQVTGSVPLYRFRLSNGDHLTTTNPGEGYASGYLLDGILGYVPQ